MIRSSVSRATILLAVVLIGGSSCTSTLDPVRQLAAANRAVDDWVADHPTGWWVSLGTERALFRPDFSTSCSQGGKNNLVTLRFAPVATEIDLFFSCPLGPTATVDELRSAFAFAVLTELPHGINAPGWRFNLRTPTTHVTDVVTFVTAEDGRLNITIETPLYAVSGRSLSESCEVPADAPSPPECFLLREHPIPLRLLLRAPFDGSALQ